MHTQPFTCFGRLEIVLIKMVAARSRGGMVVGTGDGWLLMVGGGGGVWLVEVTGMSHYFFFFVFSLLCCNYFQNILSTFFYIFG